MPHNMNTPAPPDPPDLDLLLTLPEAARLMRLSVRSLERLAEVGEGPPRVQLTSRRVAFWRKDVVRWLETRTAPAKQAA